MKCFEIYLGSLLRVSMMGSTVIRSPKDHIERCVEEYIVYFIKSGSITLREGKDTVRLAEGDIYLFNRGEYQCAVECEECEFYYFHFDIDRLVARELSVSEYWELERRNMQAFVNHNRYSSDIYDYIRVLIPQHLHVEDKTKFSELISHMRSQRIAKYNGTHSPEMRMMLVMEGISLLMRLESIAKAQLSSGYEGRNGHAHETVEKLLEYIENHFTENFTSEDVVAEMHVDYDYANRVFRRHIGYPIMQYRNRLRMQMARRLLFKHSIEHTAQMVGFDNPYYFCRLFKKMEGISPSDYRSLLQSTNEN